MSAWIEKHGMRATAVGSIALWLLSLGLPAYFRYFEYFPGMNGGESETSIGLECLLFGWWGPLLVSAADPEYVPLGFRALLPPTEVGAFLASFAWYANPLWVWNVVRIFSGRRVLVSAAAVSVVLAFASLEPVTIWSDDHGVGSAHVPLIGVYVWAAAISVPLLGAVLSWRPPRVAA